MILSKSELETISVGVMRDFNKFFYSMFDSAGICPAATPIDLFATEYLGLDVTYYHLSNDGNFCGLTAYADTEFQFEIDGKIQSISLKQNQVVLDMDFIAPGRIKALCSKRRFTLAHECAHQILFQMERDTAKIACYQKHSYSENSHPRELKTWNDWNEWRANMLGAAILMPWKRVEEEFCRLHNKCPLKSYEGRFPEIDREVLNSLCRTFLVSQSAMVIRLEQMGYIKKLPKMKFHGPVEVLA